MSLLTGARRANVLAMKWVEIDVKRAEWRIPRMKNDDPHTIPLMPEALAILVQRQSGSESVSRSSASRSVTNQPIYSRLDVDPMRESMERATSAILIAKGRKRLQTFPR